MFYDTVDTMAEFDQKTVDEASEANSSKFKDTLFLTMFNIIIFISVELNNFIKHLFTTKSGDKICI